MRKPNYKKINFDYIQDETYDGQSIERQIEQAETSNQPIEQAAPIIYTARKDGILAAYDIRTDRFEIARNAMNKVAASYKAKREEFIKKTNENNNLETA